MKIIDWPLKDFRPFYNIYWPSNFLSIYTTLNNRIVDIVDFVVDNPRLFDNPLS